MIIGITGTNAAGKGETANILKRLGYKYYSLSDIIREEAASREEEPNRDNLIRIGNEFRIKFGEGVWGRKLAEKLKHEEHDKIVVDSIRHPLEIKELKKIEQNKYEQNKQSIKKFILLSIDTPLELRFQRAIKRARPGDPKTGADFDDFKKKEELEKTSGKNVQQLSEAMKLADFHILNTGTLKNLEENVLNVLNKLN
ncbi:TPA: dephospho-CoA kinase [Candidatus Woesearchaeota archaeon]|nr:dephospho-CoA kinase [Candidatus Woesearchaeota archaeon]